MQQIVEVVLSNKKMLSNYINAPVSPLISLAMLPQLLQAVPRGRRSACSAASAGSELTELPGSCQVAGTWIQRAATSEGRAVKKKKKKKTMRNL